MSLDPRLVRAAKLVIKREMHQYDQLAKKPKLRFERPVVRDKEERNPYQCAHHIDLDQPCEFCERTEQDCHVYEIAKLFRIKELLAKL